MTNARQSPRLICLTCNIEKPQEDFCKFKCIKNNVLYSGYYRKCKECENKRTRLYKRNNREIMNKASRRWEKKNLHKRKANRAVLYAINTGRLIRKPCKVCGMDNTEGHHRDYSKPLDVIWLCRKHHLEEHRRLYAKVKARTGEGEA